MLLCSNWVCISKKNKTKSGSTLFLRKPVLVTGNNIRKDFINSTEKQA